MKKAIIKLNLRKILANSTKSSFNLIFKNQFLYLADQDPDKFYKLTNFYIKIAVLENLLDEDLKIPDFFILYEICYNGLLI